MSTSTLENERVTPASSPFRGISSRNFLGFFWLGVAGLVVYALLGFRADSIVPSLLGCLIAFCSVLPMYLWCMGRVPGLPLLPIYMTMYLIAYAIPFWDHQPQIMKYSQEVQIQAAVTTAGFLLIITLVWMYFAKQPTPPGEVRVFEGKNMNAATLLLLGASCLFVVLMRGGWLNFLGETFTLLRSIFLGAGLAGTFIAAYRMSTGQMMGAEKAVALAFIGLAIVTHITTLILANTMGCLVMLMLGHFLAAKRIHVVFFVVSVTILGFLHMGKADMRVKYWKKDAALQLSEFPGYFKQWVGYSARSIADKSRGTQRSKSQATPMERLSNVHMLMLVQSQTPAKRPYIEGATYRVLPEMLVPRILYPNKPRAHAGTYMLSMYYGLQDQKATITTTIAFSLVSEAFANFGYLGVAVLAIGIGALLGLATCLSAYDTGLSVRLCFALMCLQCLYLSADSASIFVSTFSQSLFILAIGAALFSTRLAPGQTEKEMAAAEEGRAPAGEISISLGSSPSS